MHPLLFLLDCQMLLMFILYAGVYSCELLPSFTLFGIVADIA